MGDDEKREKGKQAVDQAEAKAAKHKIELPILGTDRTAGMKRVKNRDLIDFKSELERRKAKDEQFGGTETLVLFVETMTDLTEERIKALTPMALVDLVRRIRIEMKGPETGFEVNDPKTGRPFPVTVNLEELEIVAPDPGPETYDLVDGIEDEKGKIHYTIVLGSNTVEDVIKAERQSPTEAETLERVNASLIKGIGDLPKPVTGTWYGYYKEMTFKDRRNIFDPATEKHGGMFQMGVEVEAPSGQKFTVEVPWLDFFD